MELLRLIQWSLDTFAVMHQNNEDAEELMDFCLTFRDVVNNFENLPGEIKLKMIPLLRLLEKHLKNAEAWLNNYESKQVGYLGRGLARLPFVPMLRKYWNARSWHLHMERLYTKFQRINSGMTLVAWTWQYKQSLRHKSRRTNMDEDSHRPVPSPIHVEKQASSQSLQAEYSAMDTCSY